ncbi:diacylglycerol O-acyltransferase [Burkholderiaceae bacterium]|nr:diacylglycerol O-acyltransferase [Burkholderiaceae bacterium]
MSTCPMNPVDAAWFHMDGPANPAVVTALLLTAKPLNFAKVRAVYEARLARIDRFRQRVVERGLPLPTPHWEDVADFDIDRHVHHAALPAPHDRAALCALLDDIASSPLPRDVPLWQVHVIDGVDHGSALVMRYHHCIGDGAAMMAVARRLFDTSARRQAQEPPAIEPEPEVAQGLLSSAFESVEQSAREVLAATGAAWDALMHPQPLIDKAALVLDGAGVLIGDLLKSPDPQSPFKGEFGVRKHVAWSKPVAIADAKAVAAPFNAKVNDVLVAAMAGALRTYLLRRGVDVNHTTVRAMVPVDLRPPERVGELGNEFGLVILDLPVAAASPVQRLSATKARMDELKRSPEAIGMRLLLDVFGRGPKVLEEVAQDLFGSKVSLVMTNVAGPRKTMYLAGTPIERMMFWVPHPGDQMGVGISIMSYRGMASMALIADARLVPDPQTITDEFDREFAQMHAHLLAANAKRAAAKRKAAAAATARAV